MTERRVIEAKLNESLVADYIGFFGRDELAEGLDSLLEFLEPYAGKTVTLIFSGPDAFIKEDDNYWIPDCCYVKEERLKMTENNEKEKEYQSLLAFAREILICWPRGDVDGGELQDIAVKHGLLVGTEVTEPCAENCSCAESEWDDFPMICFKRAELIVENEKEKT